MAPLLALALVATACSSTMENSAESEGALAGALECPPAPALGSQWSSPAGASSPMNTAPIHNDFKDKTGKKIDFDCYGGCGPSSKVMRRADREFVSCQPVKCKDPSTGAEAQRFYRLRYKEIRGSSHQFCTWHDGCYLACARELGDGSHDYDKCARYCDFGCVNPIGFNASRAAGSFENGKPKVILGAEAALIAAGGREGAKKWIPITAAAGDVPLEGWAASDCGLWALPAALGVNLFTNELAAHTGTAVYTELVEASPVMPSCTTHDPEPAECGETCGNRPPTAMVNDE